MDHIEINLPKVDHTPADLDEPAKLLLKAAALIEERGLAKHTRCDGQGRLCFYGALSVASNGDPEMSWINRDIADASGMAERRMVSAVGYQDVAQWNNAPHRTKEQVVAKMRAVALGLLA